MTIPLVVTFIVSCWLFFLLGFQLGAQRSKSETEAHTRAINTNTILRRMIRNGIHRS